jgi:four helix bundle protein
MIRNRKLFRFLEWEVYGDAQEFFKEILEIIRRLPADIRYSVGSQVLSSALSIILNIAEGSGRGTDKELNRFFNISIGSINETVAGLDVLLRNGYITKEKFNSLLKKLESISKQLGGFKKKIGQQS